MPGLKSSHEVDPSELLAEYSLALKSMPDPRVEDLKSDANNARHMMGRIANFPTNLFAETYAPPLMLTMPDEEEWQPGTIVVSSGGNWIEWDGKPGYSRAGIVNALVTSGGNSWVAEVIEQGVLVYDALPTFKVAQKAGILKRRFTETDPPAQAPSAPVS